MIRSVILFCLVAFVAISCNSASSESVNPETGAAISTLKKDVIAMHDTAMARMNHIGQLQKKLQQGISSEDSVVTMATYASLQAARDDMMNWMREFEVPVTSEEVQMDYLKTEYDRIRKVDENMVNAIAKAEQFLEDKALD